MGQLRSNEITLMYDIDSIECTLRKRMLKTPMFCAISSCLHLEMGVKASLLPSRKAKLTDQEMLRHIRKE